MPRLIFPTRQPVLQEKLLGLSHLHNLNERDLSRTFGFEAQNHAGPMGAIEGFEGVLGEGTESWEFDGQFFSNIIGIDNPPRVMAKPEVSTLGDRFTKDLILQGVFPLTLRALLDGIEGLSGEKALPIRQLFLVAEGGQHQASHPDFPLNARLVFAWRQSDSSMPEILLSTVPHLDEKTALMQLIAWSIEDEAFHLFERLGEFWTWAGNGYHAFDSRSRGRGPFDSHINGGLVMKELKFPWAHWHSMASTIPENLLEGTDYGQHPALSKLDRAEDLEPIIMKANRVWAKARLRKDEEAGEVKNPKNYMRQVLTATSANLISSDVEFDEGLSGPMSLPRSFFLDTDSISKIARRAGLSNPVPSSLIEINGAHYVQAVRDLNIGVQMSDAGPRISGDTHFSFLVPERAFEDHVVVIALERSKLISARMLLCLHLVDFANPLESRMREVLMRDVPNGPMTFKPGALEEPMLEKIRQHADIGGDAEAEFLAYWDAEDLETLVATELGNYFDRLRINLSTFDGVLEVMRLAEARKNNFRRRKLHEFEATIARSTQNITDLFMRKDATIFSDAAFV